MPYKNMLAALACNSCENRNTCFLQRIPMQRYPEQTQNFVIHLPPNIFSFNKRNHRWYGNYSSVESQLIAFYDSQNCSLKENRKYPLSDSAQKESDRQFIRDNFKSLLKAAADIAAKALEDTEPEASIIFDGIGLVFASDYIEAIDKILSMFNTYDKMIKSSKFVCLNYSECQ